VAEILDNVYDKDCYNVCIPVTVINGKLSSCENVISDFYLTGFNCGTVNEMSNENPGADVSVPNRFYSSDTNVAVRNNNLNDGTCPSTSSSHNDVAMCNTDEMSLHDALSVESENVSSEANCDTSTPSLGAFSELEQYKSSHGKNLMVAYININSLLKTFDEFKEMMT
jgi:hypothetical protein